MSYRVNISPNNSHQLSDAYDWWKNFIKAELLPLHDINDDEEFFRACKEVYIRYHISWVDHGRQVEFEKEEYYTWFIMRWS